MEPASLALILGASAASSAASVYNNRQNIKYAQEANDETIGLANTAHQREVRDLIAAGLNPILSATGSGASTPNLRVPDLQSIDGGIASNANGLARYASEQQKLLNEKTVAETGATVASAANLAEQNKNLQVQNKELEARIRNIDADTELKRKEMGSRSGVGKTYEDAKSIVKDVPKVLEKTGVQLTPSGFLVPVNSAKRVVEPRQLTPGYSMPRRSRPKSGNGWRFHEDRWDGK